MALTLATAQNMTQDVLVQGVVETLIKESAVLRYLPFMELNGSGLTYNQEATLGSSTWYGVGDNWIEDAMTVVPKTASLKILGGDVDVDNFLEQTFRDPNMLKAEAINRKAKAVAYEFNNAFFNGSGASNQPAGLNSLITSGQTFSLGANGGIPTLDDFDRLLDMVKPGKPDCIFMSKRSRRLLKKLRRDGGNILETDVNKFGQRVEFYDGIPIEVDDNIPDNYSAGTAGNTASRIYAVRFGYLEGLVGLMNGLIQVEDVGKLETKDATRTRLKWYVGLVNFRDVSCAMMTGVLGS